MYEAMSIAATGLRTQQMRLDVIANNVANTNTVGYKGTRLDFKDALYTTGLVPGWPRSPEESQQKGHGVLTAHVGREFRPGNFERTEAPLDFAIENEGFFSVRDQNGNTLYTRKGNFSLSVEGGTSYLVSSEGFYLLDENGNRVEMPLGTNSITADVDGTLHFLIGDLELSSSRLGIFTFRNIYGLASFGDGNYEATPAAGQRLQVNDDVTVRQGMLEMSNVHLAEEMTRMIRTQRAFQLASRALSTADDMEGVANTMRR